MSSESSLRPFGDMTLFSDINMRAATSLCDKQIAPRGASPPHSTSNGCVIATLMVGPSQHPWTHSQLGCCFREVTSHCMDRDMLRSNLDLEHGHDELMSQVTVSLHTTNNSAMHDRTTSWRPLASRRLTGGWLKHRAR